MKYTSAQAAKILRRYQDELAALRSMEDSSKSFLAAVGEDIESLRPAYDYTQTQRTGEELEEKIRIVKHALNVFNSTYVIPEFNMTIDEMLVYLPQLSGRAARLRKMKDVLPKVRESSSYGHSQIIDYRYINYDPAEVQRDYDVITDRLARAQTALDYANSTVAGVELPMA